MVFPEISGPGTGLSLRLHCSHPDLWTVWITRCFPWHWAGRLLTFRADKETQRRVRWSGHFNLVIWSGLVGTDSGNGCRPKPAAWCSSAAGPRGASVFPL